MRTTDGRNQGEPPLILGLKNVVGVEASALQGAGFTRNTRPGGYRASTWSDAPPPESASVCLCVGWKGFRL